MDVMQRNGQYPLPPGAPDTLGVEFSGIVTELGEGGGKRWKVGDEVIGLAAGVSPASLPYALPSTMPHLSWLYADGVVNRALTLNTFVCMRRI